MSNTSSWEGVGVASVDRAQGSAARPTYARLATGVTLPYVVQGKRDGVPLVLLHGLTDSLRSMGPLLSHLPDDIRAFALTLRGHGDAEKRVDAYRPEDFAADVAAWMDVVGLSSAVIVGHSMGAHVAQRFASEYPERTRALVLMGAFADFAGNQAVAGLWAEVARLEDPIPVQFAREFQESTLNQPVPPAFLDMAVAESCKVPARVWRAALRGLIECDLRDVRTKIAQPTLLIWGAGDSMVPRGDQEQLLGSLRNAQLRVHTEAGHAVHWEEPERVARELLAFAREL